MLTVRFGTTDLWISAEAGPRSYSYGDDSLQFPRKAHLLLRYLSTVGYHPVA